jgi:dolichol kinase
MAYAQVSVRASSFGSVAIGLTGAVFAMLPLRLDDNLTIPLFVGFAGWVVCAMVGIVPG